MKNFIPIVSEFRVEIQIHTIAVIVIWVRTYVKWRFWLPNFKTCQETNCHFAIYIYIYILPYPCRVEFSSEWSNSVAISVYCKALHIWIELSVAVQRMYVNNNNCDS